MAVDTLQMQRRLSVGGFTNKQADTLTKEIATIITEHLATKDDLAALRTEMMGKFAEVDSKIAAVRSEVAEVRGEVAAVRGEVAELKGEVARLTAGMADFKISFAKWGVGLALAMMLGFAGMSVAIVLSLSRLAG